MKVLQLGMGWFPQQPGGLNRVYYDLFQSLPRVGAECRGVVLGDPTDAALAPSPQMAAPRDAKLFRRYRGLQQATRNCLAAHKIDLVASHFALYTWPVLRLIRPLPMVVHFHGPWALESKREGASSLAVAFKSWIERSVYLRGQRYIVLSEAFRKVLAASYGVDETRIRIVPGQVDTDRFHVHQTRVEARGQLGWPTDRPIVVAVRRLVRRMGLENLIRAIAQVRRHTPEVLLIIAGKGPLLAELQQLIATLDLDQSVRLLGYVSDQELPALYRAADVSIVPTASLEGFGLIAAESLAAGTPVLVTPVGGLPEVVQPLSPAMVMKSVEVADIADAVQGVLSGRLVLPGESACRQYAVERFHRHVIAAQTKAVYEEALGL